MRVVHLPRKVAFAFTLMACVSLLGVSGVARPQDSSQKPGDDAVADAARKSRERKKETAKPKKVFTNEDLGELKSNSVSTVGQDGRAAGKAAEGDKNQGEKPKEQPNGASGTADAGREQEKIWRQRFQQAYARLAQLEKEMDILQREDNKAQLQYYPDPQKALAEGYTRKDINDKTARTAAKKQEIDQQKQHISDLEDDLRKAGGDPGWAAPR
jgi:hypothetical protein